MGAYACWQEKLNVEEITRKGAAKIIERIDGGQNQQVRFFLNRGKRYKKANCQKKDKQKLA